MIVVTGAPRSGTSLMMRLLGNALGMDKIVGVRELPRDEAWRESQRQLFPGITDEQIDRMDGCVTSFNPDGYWETPWVSTGIPDDTPEFPSDHIIKLVGPGLSKTDPKHVDRVIYMLRDPREQAESLGRIAETAGLGDAEQVSKTPDAFLNQTRLICEWLSRNPDVPVSFVNLYFLRRYTDTIIESLQDQIGGRWDGSIVRPIDQDCPTPHIPDGDEWLCAYDCYYNLSAGTSDYGGIVSQIERCRNSAAAERASKSEWSSDVAAAIFGA